jgi:hypothetical protein
VLCAFALWCATASVPLPLAADTVAGRLAGPERPPISDSGSGPVLRRPLLHPFRADTVPRARAVMLSDGYATRLTIHRYGSYAMLPLFAGQYVLGSRLLAQKDGVYDGTRRVPIDATLRRNHALVAQGVGALFVVNTTTGLWNLWEARHDGSHSTRRTVHVLSMLGANAGFVVTGLMGGKAVDRRPSDARAHRNVALASMGLATTGVALMWF